MKNARGKELLAVACTDTSAGGGALRALRSLEYYSKFFRVSVYIPLLCWVNVERGLTIPSVTKIAGYSTTYRLLVNVVPRLIKGFRYVPFSTLGFEKQKLLASSEFDIVVSMHETLDSVLATYRIAERMNSRKVALLQLPPFYSDHQRLINIRMALDSWSMLLRRSCIKEFMEGTVRPIVFRLDYNLDKAIHSRVLPRFDLLIAVSKSIPYEMGEPWPGRIHALDPGVALNSEDLSLISDIKSKVKGREDYIVFGGRPDPLKGLVDALLAFKLIVKRKPEVKMIITNVRSGRLASKIIGIIRALELEGKVVTLSYLPRADRFLTVARARLMLYPSHVDSYSYAVLESLHLGTPVVGYSIPALSIYYKGLRGVRLVREWDLDALVAEALDMLEKPEETEPPRTRTWEEILREEVALLQRVID